MTDDRQPATKKSLGQHWLNDQASLEAMLAAAAVGPDDVVLEIGPGPGALTRLLAAAARQVVAVEFDPALAQALPGRLGLADVPADEFAFRPHGPGFVAQAGNVTAINADILRFDLTSLPPGYKVAANIPYYLTSNVLRVLCESANPFSTAALLVQKEVAARVCAPPGQMSLLSASVQFYCEAALGPVIPAALFTPPPQVDSQILGLRRRAAPLFSDVAPRDFFRVVKAGFSQRRKTVLNSLSAGLQMDRGHAAAVLASAAIPPTARAQTLSLADWHRLVIALDAHS